MLFCAALISYSVALTSCTETPPPPPSPVWNQQTTSQDFDLPDIQHAGELIALTISGPDTYYDYQGRQLGLHYLLCQQFATHIAVRLRMEICRDTAELFSRLAADEADIIAVPLSQDSLSPGWQVPDTKPLLLQALHQWYSPQMVSQTRAKEQQLLSLKKVRRRSSPPILSKGVISHYDQLFRTYARRISWDWRLLAAQCYQESTFDPSARSWAGAQGLMQIMPATAKHLGFTTEQINDPEQNIHAATLLLKELYQSLSDVPDPTERQNIVLASYNGGLHHIRDAMRLCRRDGHNPYRWEYLQRYILKLSEPKYYQDTLVHYGYMRGQETAQYVDKIRERYKQYKTITKRK